MLLQSSVVVTFHDSTVRTQRKTLAVNNCLAAVLASFLLELGGSSIDSVVMEFWDAARAEAPGPISSLFNPYPFL